MDQREGIAAAGASRRTIDGMREIIKVNQKNLRRRDDPLIETMIVNINQVQEVTDQMNIVGGDTETPRSPRKTKGP